MTYCLKLYINICVEDAILPITVRWTGILGQELGSLLVCHV